MATFPKETEATEETSTATRPKRERGVFAELGNRGRLRRAAAVERTGGSRYVEEVVKVTRAGVVVWIGRSASRRLAEFAR